MRKSKLNKKQKLMLILCGCSPLVIGGMASAVAVPITKSATSTAPRQLTQVVDDEDRNAGDFASTPDYFTVLEQVRRSQQTHAVTDLLSINDVKLQTTGTDTNPETGFNGLSGSMTIVPKDRSIQYTGSVTITWNVDDRKQISEDLKITLIPDTDLNRFACQPTTTQLLRKLKTLSQTSPSMNNSAMQINQMNCTNFAWNTSTTPIVGGYAEGTAYVVPINNSNVYNPNTSHSNEVKVTFYYSDTPISLSSIITKRSYTFRHAPSKQDLIGQMFRENPALIDSYSLGEDDFDFGGFTSTNSGSVDISVTGAKSSFFTGSVTLTWGITTRIDIGTIFAQTDLTNFIDTTTPTAKDIFVYARNANPGNGSNPQNNKPEQWWSVLEDSVTISVSGGSSKSATMTVKSQSTSFTGGPVNFTWDKDNRENIQELIRNRDLGNIIWDDTSTSKPTKQTIQDAVDSKNAGKISYWSELDIINITVNPTSGTGYATITVKSNSTHYVNTSPYNSVTVNFTKEVNVPVTNVYYDIDASTSEIHGWSAAVKADPNMLLPFSVMNLNGRTMAGDCLFGVKTSAIDDPNIDNLGVFNNWPCKKIVLTNTKWSVDADGITGRLCFGSPESASRLNLSEVETIDMSGANFWNPSNPVLTTGSASTAQTVFANSDLSSLKNINLTDAIFAGANMVNGNGQTIQTSNQMFRWATAPLLETINVTRAKFAVSNMSTGTNTTIQTGYQLFGNMGKKTGINEGLPGLKRIILTNTIFAASNMTPSGNINTAIQSFGILYNLNSLEEIQDLDTVVFAASNMTSGVVSTAHQTFRECQFTNPTFTTLNLKNVKFAASDMNSSGSVSTANQTFATATFPALESIVLGDDSNNGTVFACPNMTSSSTSLVYTANQTFSQTMFGSNLRNINIKYAKFSVDNMVPVTGTNAKPGNETFKRGSKSTFTASPLDQGIDFGGLYIQTSDWLNDGHNKIMSNFFLDVATAPNPDWGTNKIPVYGTGNFGNDTERDAYLEAWFGANNYVIS